MGWGLRFLAVFVGLIALGLGAWPLTLFAALYLLFSFRRPRSQRPVAPKRQVLAKSSRPLKRYVLGATLLLLSAVALAEGGFLSPVVFLLGGLALIFSPQLWGGRLSGLVTPLDESILLRSRIFPFRWYALAEVKLESQDQARGIAAMEGQILVFTGKNPSTLQVLSAYALGHKQAEAKIIRRLQKGTRMLSQRGAHLLPLDSTEASERVSLELDRLRVGTDDFEAVSSLPFDVITLRVRDGLVTSYRAFNTAGEGGAPAIPSPDLSPERQPLFAEVVQEIEDKHGWPGPDEFTSFLATLDASRAEPLADRIRTRGDGAGLVAAETPGGAEVKLTRAQLRAVARIYG